jgi:hypothetical protein
MTAEWSEKERERNAELTRLAWDILGRGVPRGDVEQAVVSVQRAKATQKTQWTYNLRYGHAVTAKERNAADKAATALKRVLPALRSVANDRQFALDDHPIDLAALEKLLRHLQTIADSKVRAGSRFDARKLFAVQKAAVLLRACGKPLTMTRHGAFDQLAATLWGDPEADFLHYLREYMKLRTGRGAARSWT